MTMNCEKYHMISTLYDPTIITASVKCKFYSKVTFQLICAQSTTLQIWDINEETVLSEGLKFQVTGNILHLLSFTPKNSQTDWLVVFTSELALYILCFNEATGKIEIVTEFSNSDVKQDFIDWRFKNMLTCWTSKDSTAFSFDFLLCYLVEPGRLRFVLSEDVRNKNFQAFDISIEEYHIKDIVKYISKSTTSNHPKFSILWEDSQQKVHFKSYELNIKSKTLKDIKFSKNKIDQSTHKLINFRDAVILISFEKIVALKQVENLEEEKKIMKLEYEFKVGEIESFCIFRRKKVNRLILGDEWGALHVLDIRFPPNFSSLEDPEINKKIWVYENIGKTSLAASLNQLDDSHLFVGAKSGDSKVIKIFVNSSTRQTNIKVKQSFTNVGPINDLIFPSTSPRSFLISSGNNDQGSLRICRQGKKLEENNNILLSEDIYEVSSLEFSTFCLLLLKGLEKNQVLLYTYAENELSELTNSIDWQKMIYSAEILSHGCTSKDNGEFFVLCQNKLSLWSIKNNTLVLDKIISEVDELKDVSAVFNLSDIFVCVKQSSLALLRNSTIFHEISFSEAVLSASVVGFKDKLVVAVLLISGSILIHCFCDQIFTKVYDNSDSVVNLSQEENFFIDEYLTKLEMKVIDEKLFLFASKANGFLLIWSLNFANDAQANLVNETVLKVTISVFDFVLSENNTLVCYNTCASDQTTASIVSYCSETNKFSSSFLLSTFVEELGILSIAVNSKFCVFLSNTKRSLKFTQIPKETSLYVKTKMINEEVRKIGQYLIKQVDFIIALTVHISPEFIKSKTLDNDSELHVCEESFIRMYERDSLKLKHSYHLNEFEQGMCFRPLQIKHQGSIKSYVIVGTCFLLANEVQPRKGRLLLFSVESQAGLSLVFEMEVHGALLNLSSNFIPSILEGLTEDYFVGTINGEVLLFEAYTLINEPTENTIHTSSLDKMEVEGPLDSENSIKIRIKATYKKNFLIRDIKTFETENEILIGDIETSLSVIEVIRSELDSSLKLQEKHRDYDKSSALAVHKTASNTYVCSDEEGNIKTFSASLSQDTNELFQKHILTLNGAFNVIHRVNGFRILPSIYTENLELNFQNEVFRVKREACFFTDSGYIGVIYELNFELYFFLTKVLEEIKDFNCFELNVYNSDEVAPKNYRVVEKYQVLSKQIYNFIDGVVLQNILKNLSDKEITTVIGKLLSNNKRKRNETEISSLVTFLRDVFLTL